MAFERNHFTASERADQLAAERRGRPFLIYRDVDRAQRLLTLEGDRFSVGREPGNDMHLGWDPQASRVHALLERVGGRWTVTDDQLSRNGTYVNGTRLRGRRRLSDHDVIRFGSTTVHYRDPADSSGETAPAAGSTPAAELTPAQHRVLLALCRPLLEDASGQAATPQSNGEIAAELTISVEAIRSHMKQLFRLFEVPDLPQNRKRAELARRALAAGVVSLRDFEG